MDYQYNIGDKVRILPALKHGETYFMRSGPRKDRASVLIGWSWRNRSCYFGKIVTIEDYDDYGRYVVEEMSKEIAWADEMFESTTRLFTCDSLL